jgi:hypothetical protein
MKIRGLGRIRIQRTKKLKNLFRFGGGGREGKAKAKQGRRLALWREEQVLLDFFTESWVS